MNGSNGVSTEEKTGKINPALGVRTGRTLWAVRGHYLFAKTKRNRICGVADGQQRCGMGTLRVDWWGARRQDRAPLFHPISLLGLGYFSSCS